MSKRKIFIAGHRGMVGRAILRQLKERKDVKVITATRASLDLTDQACVRNFFETVKPHEVILAAAKVGGIQANNIFPAEFIYQNLQIQSNIIHQSHMVGVQKLLFLGSSCIYPKFAQQPIEENALLTGILEPSNEPYAIAKIAGIKMCESYNRQYGRDYRSVMPTNLYGPGDNYHPENSHVIPALIRRIHEAKISNASEVVVWGTGKPKREFLFVDDMAEASLFVHELDKVVFDANIEPMMSHVNIGTGVDFTICEVAETIKEIIGFKGSLKFDATKLDGAPRKLLNLFCIKRLGWQYKTEFKQGLVKAYEDFFAHNPHKNV